MIRVQRYKARMVSSSCVSIILAITVFATTPADARDQPIAVNADLSSLNALDVFKECDVCPEMVVMPLGSFMMGARPEESRNPFDIYGPDATLRRREPNELNIIPDEYPRHRVEIDIPFAIGRDEITYAEWMLCVEENACSYIPDHRVPTFDHGYVELKPVHPVINISFNDVKEYVDWLNQEVGQEVYRLPTEAEWEFAARAGAETRFPQGQELSAVQANFSRKATEQVQGVEFPDLVDRSVPVAGYELNASNAWGVRHIIGNVLELTLSCWTFRHLGLLTSSEHYRITEYFFDCRRVSKGGSFRFAMDGLRPSRRYRPKQDNRYDDSGFRLVRVLN